MNLLENCEQFMKQYTPKLLNLRKGNQDVVLFAKGMGLLETLWQDNRYDLVILYRTKIYVPLYNTMTFFFKGNPRLSSHAYRYIAYQHSAEFRKQITANLPVKE